jgi:hypothetical protein
MPGSRFATDGVGVAVIGDPLAVGTDADGLGRWLLAVSAGVLLPVQPVATRAVATSMVRAPVRREGRLTRAAR